VECNQKEWILYIDDMSEHSNS